MWPPIVPMLGFFFAKLSTSVMSMSNFVDSIHVIFHYIIFCISFKLWNTTVIFLFYRTKGQEYSKLVCACHFRQSYAFIVTTMYLTIFWPQPKFWPSFGQCTKNLAPTMPDLLLVYFSFKYWLVAGKIAITIRPFASKSDTP
jgi:hypothetical protein